ncbi:hypothetical protein ACJMK2_017179 [Sinanodonta woodiana]|uniref:FMRFamide-activated amiloride-sensitive sodium channel n=1 Tax=Sinanodonta woodiana TaxID=1069815 RepID=A0ABD3UW24_SINWO
MKVTGLTKFDFLNIQPKMQGKTKPKKSARTAKGLMKELGSESNAHGLAKIATSTTMKRKVLWSLLVIVGFAAATSQLSLLVKKYLLFQVVEVSNTREGMPVEYPSITICNIAAMSLTKVNAKLDVMMPWFQFVEVTDFGEQNEHMQSLQGFYENMIEEAHYIGHDINNFVVKCRFNRHECNADNFTLYFDGKNYFNCFTFNRGQQNEALLMHATGPQHGLSLIISLDNDDPPPGGYGIYNVKNNIAYSAGVRVHVHAPNTMPSPTDHGFDIPPGYSSSVGLKAILNSRKSYPYGNCTNNDLVGEGGRIYRNTVFSCLQLCKQTIVVKLCGCKSAALPTPQGLEKFRYCGTVDNWKTRKFVLGEKVKLPYLICEEDILENVANDRSYEQTCRCFQPCSEMSYQKSISLSYWPLEFYQLNALQEFYKDKEPPNFMKAALEMMSNISFKYDELRTKGIPERELVLSQNEKANLTRASDIIRQNLLRLNIYLEDLSVLEFIQMPAYGLADLFADIGGTLGLWMGISVLTIMELVELIIRLVLLLANTETKTDINVVDDETVANHTLDLNGRFSSRYDPLPYQKQDPYINQSESPIC